MVHTDNKVHFINLTDPPYDTFHKVIDVFPSLSLVISAQSIQHNEISNSVYHVHPIPMQQQAKNQAPDDWHHNLIVVITNDVTIVLSNIKSFSSIR